MRYLKKGFTNLKNVAISAITTVILTIIVVAGGITMVLGSLVGVSPWSMMDTFNLYTDNLL